MQSYLQDNQPHRTLPLLSRCYSAAKAEKQVILRVMGSKQLKQSTNTDYEQLHYHVQYQDVKVT